jgi:hypothetical protein
VTPLTTVAHMTADGAPDWVAVLGITDHASGRAIAWEAREQLFEPAKRVLSSSPEFDKRLLVFQGFMASAQAFHESAIAAIDAGNPHAAFTLLRAYAENAAAILYVKDKPESFDRFWQGADGQGIRIGEITSYANQRFLGFRAIYGQLSSYAHPRAMAILSSSQVREGRTVNWSSAPRFKRPEDAIVAYAWTVELAQATRHLLYEFAATYSLGNFRPKDLKSSPPPDFHHLANGGEE